MLKKTRYISHQAAVKGTTLLYWALQMQTKTRADISYHPWQNMTVSIIV